MGSAEPHGILLQFLQLFNKITKLSALYFAKSMCKVGYMLSQAIFPNLLKGVLQIW